MLKMNVKITIKRRLRAKCAKHPGYNPESGAGKIRGNCKQCRALFEVTQARDQLHEAAARFDELARAYEIPRKKRSSSAATDDTTADPASFSLSSPTVTLEQSRQLQ